MPKEIPKEENPNAPKSEPLGESTPPIVERSTADLLREELGEFRKTMKEEALSVVREEIANASKPVRDKVPAPEVKRETGIRVVGDLRDSLYRSRPLEERKIRNPQTDAMVQRWANAKFNRDFETQRRVQRELNEIYRADDVLEGAAGAAGAIGDGTGADAIPFPLAAVISMARDKAARIRQRAQIFNSPNQSLRITTGGLGSAAMVAEGSTASNTAAGLDTIQLTKKKLQAKFSLSREMLADSAFNLVNVFVERGGAAMGRVEDIQFGRDGDGTESNVTQSIQNTVAGINWVNPTTANKVGYLDVVSLTYAAEDQYMTNATFFSNSTGLKLLSSIVDGNGRPIFVPLLNDVNVVGEQTPDAKGSIFGRPVIQVPLTSSGSVSSAPEVDIWFGDLREYAILDDGGITVDVSEHARFEEDVIVWKLTTRIDGAVLQPQAFSRLVGVSGTV